MNTPVLLSIAQITPLDPSFRIRFYTNSEAVDLYSENMETVDDLKKFPPVAVYFDGTRYWLSDGNLRVEAAQRAGHDFVWAIIHTGTPDDAFWTSIAANSKHGLGLSRTERRRAIEIVVKKWPNRSNRMIAEAVGVSGQYVSRIRNELIERESLDVPEKRIGLDGKMHPSRKTKNDFHHSSSSEALQSGRDIYVSGTKNDLPVTEETIISKSRRLVKFAMKICPDEIEQFFLGLFDEIVLQSGNEVGKKLMKDVIDRVVALRD